MSFLSIEINGLEDATDLPIDATPVYIGFSRNVFSVNPSTILIDRRAKRRYHGIICVYLNSAKAGLSLHTNFDTVKSVFSKTVNLSSSFFV